MNDFLTPDVVKYMKSLSAQDRKNKAIRFKEINSIVEANCFLFAGDSITEGYPLQELFQEIVRPVNRGIGGLKTFELIESIDSLILDLNPKNLVLLIGTNDLVLEQNPKLIASRILQIIHEVRQHCPSTKIFLQSVYPVNKKFPDVGEKVVDLRDNEDIRKINELLKENAKDLYTYIDVFSYLSDANGDLNLMFTFDGLHLNVAGYKVVTEVLKNHLYE